MNCYICNQGLWGDNDDYYMFLVGTEVRRFCTEHGETIYAFIDKLQEEVG